MHMHTARREQEREVQAAEERRRAEQRRLFEGEGPGGREEPRLRDSFPPLADGEPIHQKNEGGSVPSAAGAHCWLGGLTGRVCACMCCHSPFIPTTAGP